MPNPHSDKGTLLLSLASCRFDARSMASFHSCAILTTEGRSQLCSSPREKCSYFQNATEEENMTKEV
ncbi:MAG: hypothetical protein RUDDFDWM_002066 [Candidatus Fervidibacterota bacterium]